VAPEGDSCDPSCCFALSSTKYLLHRYIVY
jgi:hypothetical protein